MIEKEKAYIADCMQTATWLVRRRAVSHTRCWKAQEVCSIEAPELEPKMGGNVAACHFPLSDEELRQRILAGGTAADPGVASARSQVLSAQPGRARVGAGLRGNVRNTGFIRRSSMTAAFHSNVVVDGDGAVSLRWPVHRNGPTSSWKQLAGRNVGREGEPHAPQPLSAEGSRGLVGPIPAHPVDSRLGPVR